MAAAAAGDAVFRSIKASNSVSDEQLSILHFLYGKNFERAMRILDQGGVQRIVGIPSGRAVYQVAGESKNSDQYICFAEHHCTCYAFFYETVNKGEQLCSGSYLWGASPQVDVIASAPTLVLTWSAVSVSHALWPLFGSFLWGASPQVVVIASPLTLCKHQLAARMADAHKLYKEEKISDEQLALLLFKH